MCLMDVFTFMPTSVGVCTNVLPLVPLVHTNMSHTELAECFARARRSNAHTRPAAPSSAKEVKRLLTRLDTFHSCHLNTFLRAYMYATAAAIPDHVLARVHYVCVNCEPEWTARCQNLAMHVLTAELQARRAGVVPRHSADEPSALAQLRPTLPVLRHVPDVCLCGPCHFRFLGTFDRDVSGSRADHLDDDDEDNDSSNNNNDNTKGSVGGAETFSATVRVCNRGRHACTLDLPQTRTIIDGVAVANRFITTTLERQVLQPGESMDLTLTMTRAPRAGFGEFQQLIVLAVDGGAVKFFLTFTVLAPRQAIFRQRFPGCLPLVVHHSPLGRYSAPMMLQILKSVLVRQRGLSSATVVHLLARHAVNYRLQNVDAMQEAMRVMEIVKEQMNLMHVLDSYWATQGDAAAARGRLRCRSPPPSSAQPAGYLPGIDLPNAHFSHGGGRRGGVSHNDGHNTTTATTTATAATAATAAVRARDDRYFPTASTRLPDALVRAPPAVVMGIILLWLAQMDIVVFDQSFVGCDAIVYLETTPPYLRGVLMWVIDLCCALLLNSSTNGATARDLAIAFASVLVRGEVLTTSAAAAPAADGSVAVSAAVADRCSNDSNNNDKDNDDTEQHACNDDGNEHSAFAATHDVRDKQRGHRGGGGSDDDDGDDGGGGEGGNTASFAAQVELRQCAVTALVTWIALYKTRYDQLYA